MMSRRSDIPNYNPADIVANVRALLKDEELTTMVPWYRGFKGTIEPAGSDKFKGTRACFFPLC